MTRCIGCRNRRRFARGAGLSWRSTFLRCYPCWQRWQARWHIASRLAMVFLLGSIAVGCLTALYHLALALAISEGRL